MKFTIMAVDLFFKFRLAAFPHTSTPPQVWNLEVLTIEEVANVLETLGFLDAEAAERLSAASTTVTPQLGVNTMRLTDMAALAELFFRKTSPRVRKRRMVTCWSLTVKPPRKFLPGLASLSQSTAPCNKGAEASPLLASTQAPHPTRPICHSLH